MATRKQRSRRMERRQRASRDQRRRLRAALDASIAESGERTMADAMYERGYEQDRRTGRWKCVLPGEQRAERRGPSWSGVLAARKRKKARK